MKFKKFMKNEGVNVKILTIDEDRWLVGRNVAMLIPEEVKVVLASEQTEAPQWFKDAVTMNLESNLCKLKKALMLSADGKANSIIRVFESDDGNESIGILNPFYGLLETDDILNIFNMSKDEKVIRAINYVDYKPKCVGFICQFKYEENQNNEQI